MNYPDDDNILCEDWERWFYGIDTDRVPFWYSVPLEDRLYDEAMRQAQKYEPLREQLRQKLSLACA